MAANVKYNPANIGDILKHSWLIEVVDQLAKTDPFSAFLYADTFCGFKDYPIDSFFRERLREKFVDTPLYKVQESYLRDNTYLGSVSIVKELIGDRVRVDVFDKNIEAQHSHGDTSTCFLELQSGYDVLQKMINYNLILLDPYDDFLDEYKAVIRGISWRVMESSVLLFVPYLQDNEFQDVKTFAKSLHVDFTTGTIKSEDIDHDGKYSYGMMFFPAKQKSGILLEKSDLLLTQVTQSILDQLNYGV